MTKEEIIRTAKAIISEELENADFKDKKIIPFCLPTEKESNSDEHF